MSGGDGRNDSALGGVILGLGLLLSVVVVGLTASFVFDIYERRVAVQQHAQGDCADRENCGPESLQADIRAAIAAEDIVDLGLAQIILGVAGLIFIGLTLKATRDAVREANDATDAARRAVEVTEDAAKRQLRAYVTVEIGSIKPVQPNKVPRAAVRVANSGQTPAFNVSTRFVVRLVGPDENVPVIAPITVPRKQLIIGGGTEKISALDAAFSLTEDDVLALKERRSAIVLSGCTVYEDTFGRTWWTQFCHIYDGEKLEGRYHPGLNRGI